MSERIQIDVIYILLKLKLGPDFTEPPNYPISADFRLVDMITRVLTADKKDQVLANFTNKNGILRLGILQQTLEWELIAQTFFIGNANNT